MYRLCASIASGFAVLVSAGAWCAESPVTFEMRANEMTIRVRGAEFATYVWNDPALPRPYFRRVLAPNGVEVTRTHPPDGAADKGNDDHPGFHPGAWLAFGDLGETDFWRNKARVRHVRFAEPPFCDGDTGRFTVMNAYETSATPPVLIAEETCTYTIQEIANGWLLRCESEFRARKDGVAFGDQEEMGFGVRIATPLTVKHGTGLLWNSEDGRNEAGTWGKTARWCAAAGNDGSRQAGMAILAGPANFRASWFHTRDYGLIVANPFGRKAMTGADDADVKPDATPLPVDTPLRLVFGVFVFSGATEATSDIEAAWNHLAAPGRGPN